VNRGYNELKTKALTIFEQEGPLAPPEWAVRARFWPIRASYSYLSRLHKWGLLGRSRDARGCLLYLLSERGRSRLAWLRGRKKKRRQ
jgi:hypothetical protein